MIPAFLIERFSARLLEANWALKGALVPHRGKTVHLAIGSHPPVCWEILDNYFRIVPETQPPDLRLWGNDLAVFQTWLRQLAKEPIMGAGLSIEGDIALAEALQQATQWEEMDFGAFFSPWVAPVAGPILNKGVAFLQQRVPDWGDHLRVYLQEEKALLPTATRFSEFREGVIACRQAVERLEARFQGYS